MAFINVMRQFNIIAMFLVTTFLTDSMLGRVHQSASASDSSTSSLDSQSNIGLKLVNFSKSLKEEHQKSIRESHYPMTIDSKGDHVSCFQSPFVVCDKEKPEFSGRIDRGSSFRPHVPKLLQRNHKPLVINLINIPWWLRRELPDGRAGSNGLCVFRDGPVTEETDVVAVHAKLLKEDQKPLVRWAGQLYVLINWEPPSKYESLLATGNSVWNNEFNLTMSYRVDSDIFVPSQLLRFDPKPPRERPDYASLFHKKKKTAVWFVSNCVTPSWRELYVTEMRRYIDVDIYGACGQPAPCVFKMEHQPCLFDILQDYKFYLSFENSFCADYVTEKAFKIYSHKIFTVPVVRGALDYDRYFPPNTFINAAHFQSPRDLALYLKEFGQNMTSYTKILEYKDMYDMLPVENNFFQLCLALHSPMLRQGTYNMRNWVWHGCYDPPDLPEMWWRQFVFALLILIVIGQFIFCCWSQKFISVCYKLFMVLLLPVYCCKLSCFRNFLCNLKGKLGSLR